MSEARRALREANERFYRALEGLDLPAMEGLWLHEPWVRCVHPGWEAIGGFQKTFEENGGQIVQKLWAPLNTTDFAPYLSQIKRDADAVFALMVSGSALRFPKQYQDAGLKAKLPLIGGGTSSTSSCCRRSATRPSAG